MKKILIILCLTLVYHTCFSQSEAIHAIRKAIRVDKSLSEKLGHEKKAFVFNLAIHTNNEGRVDSVCSSESELFDRGLVNLKEINKELKRNKSSFLDCKDQILVITIGLQLGNETSIASAESSKSVKHLISISEPRPNQRKIKRLETILIVV